MNPVPDARAVRFLTDSELIALRFAHADPADMPTEARAEIRRRNEEREAAYRARQARRRALPVGMWILDGFGGRS